MRAAHRRYGRGYDDHPVGREDLARLDEVADLVRRIGPSLIIAVLLDGPQLATRWPCRYASIVADDPGSSGLRSDVVHLEH